MMKSEPLEAQRLKRRRCQVRVPVGSMLRPAEQAVGLQRPRLWGAGRVGVWVRVVFPPRLGVRFPPVALRQRLRPRLLFSLLGEFATLLDYIAALMTAESLGAVFANGFETIASDQYSSSGLWPEWSSRVICFAGLINTCVE